MMIRLGKRGHPQDLLTVYAGQYFPKVLMCEEEAPITQSGPSSPPIKKLIRKVGVYPAGIK